MRSNSRAAADLEDRNEKHIVTPGRVLPARELLGDMLMQMGQPAQALKEYEASQEREPNRFRGLYGAAIAAEGGGDRAKASRHFARLAEMTKGADTSRPEMTRVKAALIAMKLTTVIPADAHCASGCWHSRSRSPSAGSAHVRTRTTTTPT